MVPELDVAVFHGRRQVDGRVEGALLRQQLSSSANEAGWLGPFGARARTACYASDRGLVVVGTGPSLPRRPKERGVRDLLHTVALADGSRGAPLELPGTPISSSVTPDGRLALVGTANGQVCALDLERGQVSSPRSISPGSWVPAVAHDPVSEAAFAVCGRRLVVLDRTDLTPLHVHELTRPAATVEPNADGSELLVAGAGRLELLRVLR
jgi:hypothetical protein